MKLVVKIIIAFFLSFVVKSQDHYPGGVAGAEVWYIAKHEDLTNQMFYNNAQNNIEIRNCFDEYYVRAMYNFNYSLITDKLCLQYFAPLENSISRNVFFIGERKKEEVSNLSTNFDPDLDINQVSQNRFLLSEVAMQVDYQVLDKYTLPEQTINFYNWNIYQNQQKFKSYGYRGETLFRIGEEFGYGDDLISAGYYTGNFPEFISFPFELNKNQRNRVESYLALKYGITLARNESYKNSKNLIFWHMRNNKRFSKRIFGIGRDDISMLNQLQSNSEHYKDYLISAVDGIEESNFKKQETVEIKNDNFIVFGDNNKDNKLIKEPNDFNVRHIYRVWLSQNTGQSSPDIPMSFKANIEKMSLYDELISNPKLRLWMLHDKHVTYDQVSDFNSHYVEYYEPSSLDLENKYAYFDKKHFDQDLNIYDQFTFGVGPQMIVQVRFDPVSCDYKEKYIRVNVVITGGNAPYEVKIEGHNFSLNYSTNYNISQAEVLHPDNYHISVHDSNGLLSESWVHIFIPQISVDLGPDVTLNASQPSVALDAGQDVNDPDATYQWYFDGVLLDNNTSILEATQVGEYTVVVTSGNRICEVSDTIRIIRKFTGIIQPLKSCDPEAGQITIELEGGMGTYIYNIEPPIGVPPPQNSENLIINNVPFGDYTITITDVLGENDTVTEFVSIVDPFEGMELDIFSQLLQNFEIDFNYFDGNITYPFAAVCYNPDIIDASMLVTNPNVTYKWLINGLDSGIYVPTVYFVRSHLVPNVNEYEVILYNEETGCYLSEIFHTKFGYMIYQYPSNNIYGKQINHEENDDVEEQEVVSKEIKTKIYPNPSDSGGRFFYELYSFDGTEILEGTVSLYTVTGAMLEQKQVSGQTNYMFTYELITTGVYFIRAQVNGELLTDKVIIR